MSRQSEQPNRAFSLIEVMVVIAIAGILATLAVPSFQDMALHYRAQEGARNVLMAMGQARGLSQRENQPARLFVDKKQAVVERADFGIVTPAQLAASTRRLVVGFVADRDVALPEGVTMVSVERLGPTGLVTATFAAGNDDARIVFCSSGESYYREAVSGAPVCGVGNLTSTSAKIQFLVFGKAFHLRVNEALGTIDLKAGT